MPTPNTTLRLIQGPTLNQGSRQRARDFAAIGLAVTPTPVPTVTAADLAAATAFTRGSGVNLLARVYARQWAGSLALTAIRQAAILRAAAIASPNVSRFVEAVQSPVTTFVSPIIPGLLTGIAGPGQRVRQSAVLRPFVPLDPPLPLPYPPPAVPSRPPPAVPPRRSLTNMQIEMGQGKRRGANYVEPGRTVLRGVKSS